MYECFEKNIIDDVSRVDFGSVVELVEFGVRGNINFRGNEYLITSLQAERDEWVEGYSPAKIEAMMTDPPKHLVDEITRIADEIREAVPPPRKPGRRIHRRLEAGDELDPVAWARSDPDGWSEMRRERVPRSSVRLGINCCVSSAMQPRHLLYRGAAMVALCDVLTQQGMNVGITAFSSASTLSVAERRSVLSYTVKSFTAPLEIGAAAMAVASVGFYRLIVMPAESRAATGQGHKCHSMIAMLPPGDKSGYDLILDANILDRDSAIAAVRKYMDFLKEGAQP